MTFKELLKYIAEGLIIACLLLTNVVMGNFTQTSLQDDLTVMERIYDALTAQNIIIALTAGLTAAFILWHIVRK